MTTTPEQRLVDLGITLPEAATPVANYRATMQTGKLLVVSGQLPLAQGALLYKGKLGEDISNEQGIEAARACFINIVAQIKAAVGGDLSRVVRVVRLGGFMACAPDFTDHAVVMNGASDLAVSIFGEAGAHARSTVGVPSLPLNAPVEVEAMVEVA